MEKRFVVDSMLGKLAKWLRILGFDTRCERLLRPEQLDGWRREGFLIITRNHQWRGQDQIVHLRANDPMEQLHELIAAVGISRDELQFLRRCVLCNSLLQLIPRESALGDVPDYVYETNTRFHRCPTCHKIYWPGSHPKRMTDRLASETGWSL